MDKSRRKLKKNTLRQMKMEAQLSKSTGCSKSSTVRKVCSDTGLAQEEKSQINNLNIYLKELEKEE